MVWYETGDSSSLFLLILSSIIWYSESLLKFLLLFKCLFSKKAFFSNNIPILDMRKMTNGKTRHDIKIIIWNPRSECTFQKYMIWPLFDLEMTSNVNINGIFEFYTKNAFDWCVYHVWHFWFKSITWILTSWSLNSVISRMHEGINFWRPKMNFWGQKYPEKFKVDASRPSQKSNSSKGRD